MQYWKACNIQLIQKMMAESPGLLDLLQHAPNFSMTVLRVLSVTNMQTLSPTVSKQPVQC